MAYHITLHYVEFSHPLNWPLLQASHPFQVAREHRGDCGICIPSHGGAACCCVSVAQCVRAIIDVSGIIEFYSVKFMNIDCPYLAEKFRSNLVEVEVHNDNDLLRLK